MRLLTYKEMKNVPLKLIYNKYADKHLSLIQVRCRVYDNNMSMQNALTKPLSGRALGASQDNAYITALYNKLKSVVPEYVTREQFIVKMRKGFSPEVAIVNKCPRQIKIEKVKVKTILDTKSIIKELQKQEAKEHKEMRKKKVKPLNKKEQKYVKNMDVLNNAFGKIT